MKIELLEYPTDAVWAEVKRRTLVTVGKKPVNPPTEEWKRKILNAQHSPIRYIRFSFYMEIPYYVSVHLARHVHAQPYIQSQRNDRQSKYDRNKAPQDTEVMMIYDINAEELITIMHKRLCNLADQTTKKVAQEMKRLVLEKCPEFEGLLVPLCEYRNNICTEFKPCGKLNNSLLSKKE